MDFSRTRISLRRPITDYSRVQRAISAVIRNRAALQRIPEAPLLNVGCGPNVAPGFVNLDWHWRPGVVCWDATRPLPFADAAFSGIYTEHCLEHLPFEDMPRVLAEFRRVLRGTLRIVVPDGELYLRRYAAGDALPYGEGEMSPMFSVNRIMRDHGHLFIYDFETMRVLLERAGFTDIRRESFGHGTAGLLIDSPERAVESLYVEAHAR